MYNGKKVFLYAFDREARVVNYRFVQGNDISIRQIHYLAKQMYLLAGKEQIIVYAIDDYPNLRKDYNEAIKSSDPADVYGFYDIVDRNGIYIHN